MDDRLTGRRAAPAVATAAGRSGSWLWWATADNETMTWHLLGPAGDGRGPSARYTGLVVPLVRPRCTTGRTSLPEAC
ncbi:hypothetical protein GCM10020218_045910 [Dactylosporangium vinaceum]